MIIRLNIFRHPSQALQMAPVVLRLKGAGETFQVKVGLDRFKVVRSATFQIFFSLAEKV